MVKLFELKRCNLYTILATYSISPRVANINDKSISSKDRGKQSFLRATRRFLEIHVNSYPSPI
ncbi:MAG: hypothetical protein LBB61_02480 [Treponema sp.]|nr:hypothetical protein [Treponema sp.]